MGNSCESGNEIGEGERETERGRGRDRGRERQTEGGEDETEGDERKHYSRCNRLKLHKYLWRSFNILKIILVAILDKVTMVCLFRGRFSPSSHGWP